MINFKKSSLIALCFVLTFSFSSCIRPELKRTEALSEVDFSNETCVQVVTNEDVFNLILCFDENGTLFIEFEDLISPSLENMKFKINKSFCEITANDITFTENVNAFGDDFFPKILYIFFNTADFKNERFEFNKQENSYTLFKAILTKNLIFTVQNSNDNSKIAYLIEIR